MIWCGVLFHTVSQNMIDILEYIYRGSPSAVGFLQGLVSRLESTHKGCIHTIGNGFFGFVEDRSHVVKSHKFRVQDRPCTLKMVTKVIPGHDNDNSQAASRFQGPFVTDVKASSDNHISMLTCCKAYRKSQGEEYEPEVSCPSGISCLGEILCTMLGSKIFDMGVSPHFVHSSGWAICNLKKNSGVSAELTLEKCETSMEMFLKNCQMGKPLSDEQVDYLLFSMLHTLHVLKKLVGIEHHDCFLKNFLVVYSHHYNWKRHLHVEDTPYFCYHVNDNEFYFPNLGIIPKIADFGLSEFKYGRTTSHNTIAEDLRRNRPNLVTESGYADHLDILSDMLPKLCGKTIRKINNTIYPFNSVNGVSAKQLMSECKLFDVKTKKIASVTAMLTSCGLFDHMREKPKGKCLHIRDTWTPVVTEK